MGQSAVRELRHIELFGCSSALKLGARQGCAKLRLHALGGALHTHNRLNLKGVWNLFVSFYCMEKHPYLR